MSDKKITKADKILNELNKDGMVLSGFVKADNKIMRTITNTLDLSSCITYIILLSHRNLITGECFPTVEILSKELNYDKSSISRILKKLSDKGFINVIQGNRFRAARYFFPYESFYSEEIEKKFRDNLKAKKPKENDELKESEKEVEQPNSPAPNSPAPVPKEQPASKPKNKLAQNETLSYEPQSNISSSSDSDDGFLF